MLFVFDITRGLLHYERELCCWDRIPRRTDKLGEYPVHKELTYLISTSNGYYFLDEFLPQNYYRVGDQISVPVNCRAFTRRDNRLGVSFSVRKDYGITLSGEDF